MRTPTLPLVPRTPARLARFAGLAAALTLLACGGKKDLVCSGDLAACDGSCVALQRDPAHCGACGHACDAGQVCDQGTCAYATVTDCGAAGRSCASGERCLEGRCVAPLYLACFNTGEVREAADTIDGATHTLSAAGLPLAVAPGAMGLATIGTELYAAAGTWGGVETLVRIAREPPAVRVASLWTSPVSSPDLEFLTAHGGYLYVSQSSLGKVLAVSPAGEVVAEHHFAGAINPNPLGIAFHGDHAYVALQAAAEVAVLDVSAVGTCADPRACIAEVKRIDVSALADTGAGASAMPSRVVVAGARAFVTLWNLDGSWTPPPGSHGKLAVIDLASEALDATAGLVDLGAGCLNPAEAAVSGSTLYVTCGTFDYSTSPASVRGQGIVPVALGSGAPVVGDLLPAPADAAPGKLAFCGGTGYLADRNSGRVFVLDPTQGAVQGATLCPASESGYAYVADIACGE